MERLIRVCREVINSPYLPVGRVKSRKANKWVVYVRGSVFYKEACKHYAENYNDRYSNPYLISKLELFKAIRQAYNTKLKTFVINKDYLLPERVYYYEELQLLLSKDPINPPKQKTVNHKTVNYKKDIVIDRLDKILLSIENLARIIENKKS